MSLADHLATILDRALRYRPHLALAAGHPPGKLDEVITGIAFAPESLRPSRRPGWVTGGRVFDGTDGAMPEVFSQPEIDRVQIERPLEWQAPSPPSLLIEPLARRPTGRPLGIPIRPSSTPTRTRTTMP